MRDLHLRHTLKQLARDAAGVFDDLLAAGQEIPYEIAEPGESLAFSQYVPLTAKFVRDNATELRELDSFREATETMRHSEIAATYLEDAGIAPPADPVERSTLAVTYFLARLWDGCSDFEIDEDRFSSALDEIEEAGEPEAGEVEAIVPLLGFRSDSARIELAGAAIVRADTVDVPSEAARGSRPAGGEWEPSFLISARIELDSDAGLAGAGERVAAAFERIITTLRLYKPGGVGLGPYGWVRVAGDRWRRIATGAGRPRAGGYQLDSEEIEGLIDLARTVNLHPRRMTRLRRALLRFESGLDRRGAVDALNDHLLALRFLLEGEGPAGAGMPMRAAALAAEGDERLELKGTVEGALALERELWSGEPAAGRGVPSSEIAIGIESLLRTILRRAIRGELGADVRAAADEILLGDGLAVGEGDALGDTSEWGVPAADDAARFERFDHDHDAEVEVTAAIEERAEAAEISEAPTTGEPVAAIEPEYDIPPEEETPVIEDIESQLDQPEPRPPARRHPIPFGSEPVAARAADEPDREEGADRRDRVDTPDWLREVDDSEDVTMSFPARGDNHLEELSRPPMEREEVRARVEYLFPRTETDWTVGRDSPRRRDAAAG